MGETIDKINEEIREVENQRDFYVGMIDLIVATLKKNGICFDVEYGQPNSVPVMVGDKVHYDPNTIIAGLKLNCTEHDEKLIENHVELPSEPIECATMLITADFEYNSSVIQKAFGAGEKSRANYYSPSDLRQIAEHLLVYCNHAESEND